MLLSLWPRLLWLPLLLRLLFLLLGWTSWLAGAFEGAGVDGSLLFVRLGGVAVEWETAEIEGVSSSGPSSRCLVRWKGDSPICLERKQDRVSFFVVHARALRGFLLSIPLRPVPRDRELQKSGVSWQAEVTGTARIPLLGELVRRSRVQRRSGCVFAIATELFPKNHRPRQARKMSALVRAPLTGRMVYLRRQSSISLIRKHKYMRITAGHAQLIYYGDKAL